MMQVSAITFTSNTQKSKDRKDAGQEVVKDGGAVAAVAGGTKAAKSGLNTYTQGVKRGMHVATQTTNSARNITAKSTTLWGRVCQNAKFARESVLQWGAQFKNLRYIRPLVENPVFRACAGGCGYAFGAIALLSGISDIYDTVLLYKQKLEKIN